MGKLSEALDAEQRLTPGPPCSVAAVLDQVDGDDRARLLDALEQHGMGEERLAGLIEQAGLPRPGAGQIGRHRRWACRCGTKDQRDWDGRTGRREPRD